MIYSILRSFPKRETNRSMGLLISAGTLTGKFVCQRRRPNEEFMIDVGLREREGLADVTVSLPQCCVYIETGCEGTVLRLRRYAATLRTNGR
jgi:hypothetical protein